MHEDAICMRMGMSMQALIGSMRIDRWDTHEDGHEDSRNPHARILMHPLARILLRGAQKASPAGGGG